MELPWLWAKAGFTSSSDSKQKEILPEMVPYPNIGLLCQCNKSNQAKLISIPSWSQGKRRNH